MFIKTFLLTHIWPGGIVVGMAKVMLTVEGYRCERCAHEWIPRDKEQEPVICPKCKSPYWNKPRKNAEPASSKPARSAKAKGEAKK